MLRSATFGVVIIAIVYLPILSLVGIEGKMFRPMAMTVLFALAGALVLALTLIPALASLLLPRRLTEKESFIVAVARRWYEPLLRTRHPTALGHRSASRLVMIVASAARPALPRRGVRAAARRGRDRAPGLAPAERVARGVGPADRRKLERVLKQFPEVNTVVSKTGRAEIATDPMGVEISDVFVMLKPRVEWKTADTREGLIAAIDAGAQERTFPGTIFSYSQPIELRVSELIAGVRSDVALKIFGDDLATLEARRRPGCRRARQGPGRRGRQGGADRGAAGASDPDRSRARSHATASTPATCSTSMTTLGGRAAGVVLEGQRRFPLQVRFAPEARAARSRAEESQGARARRAASSRWRSSPRSTSRTVPRRSATRAASGASRWR